MLVKLGQGGQGLWARLQGLGHPNGKCRCCLPAGRATGEYARCLPQTTNAAEQGIQASWLPSSETGGMLHSGPVLPDAAFKACSMRVRVHRSHFCPPTPCPTSTGTGLLLLPATTVLQWHSQVMLPSTRYSLPAETGQGVLTARDRCPKLQAAVRPSSLPCSAGNAGRDGHGHLLPLMRHVNRWLHGT